ncbi:class I adenylate-forming enzyme family protein [Azospirillum sp.]|uniref:class I adenylate-forming enzyme family protein n=1 Tax=Azospirillum sp. TaxID=34012 RepID=UPI003D75AB70
MFAEFRREEPDALARRLEATPLPDSVFDLLVRTAARHADAPAWRFIDDGVERTWGEVLDAVETAAAAFAALGIGPGVHVAVMAWNREEFPIAWLALARLQAVMVPINATYTTREVEYVLKTSLATVLILEAEFLPHLDALETVALPPSDVIVLGDAAPGRHRRWRALMEEAQGRRAPHTPRSPDAVLNLQYTSGTTGFSKACMLTHEYWLCLGLSSTEFFATDLRRFYVGSSFFYMVGQRILLNAMASGGCAFFPRKPGAKRFMLDVAQLECDYCALFEMVYKQPPRPSDPHNKLKLATIFAFGPESHADFQRRFDVYGQEFYGMTEIGGGTYMPAHRLAEMTGSGSCGVVAPFRDLMIADEDGNPVPTGDTGELCVRGRGLLKGYFGNVEATAQAFRNGWFRTGDLARVDAAGYHYILGRTKDMVRRSGENIAAREVEVVLRTLDDIQDAAVVPVPDDYRGEEIKAYILLAPGVDPSTCPPERIADHCARHLAAFKVPRYYEYRDAFPLTDSQRVQKKHLLSEKPDLRVGSYDCQDKIWR